MFDPTWRARALEALDRPFDLVVIGGGITGCGVMMDAAERGLRVLLVERDDLASGTSSRSSKLVHGGLRYLKQMQLKVTRESVRERDRQLALAPHLVKQVDFLYPAYSGDRTPGWAVELGLTVYDHLTRRPANKHRRVDTKAVAELAPGLDTEELDRALVYGDARVDDARLTWAVAATGYAFGGLVLTRAQVEGARRDANDEIRAVTVRDLDADRVYEVEAAAIVNATGVWVDELRACLDLGAPRLRPSRGSHILLDSTDLPLSVAITIPSPDDDRPVFAIPHPEGVVVGTTDLFHDDGIDDPRPTRGEIDYLLRTLRHAFPTRSFGDDEIRGAFAGLRPVIDSGVDDPTKASRDEEVWHEDGVWNVAGGKLTTWRAMAEETVDEVLDARPDLDRRAAPAATAGTPLAGLAPSDLAERLRATHDLDAEVAAAMASRLGSLSWTACALAQSRDELQPLVDDLDVSAAEVRAQLGFGAVFHLEDLVLRRLRVGMWRPDRVDDLVTALRPVLEGATSWDLDAEVERLEAALAGWRLDGVVPGGDEEERG
ncbi:MAG: glycerol-3-phosphate dehydrogenase/oxidase [Acidobacteriota bacterium]